MPTALITGASRGLGRAIATELARRGWTLVIDARGASALDVVAQGLRGLGAARVDAIAGDVADAAHREILARVVGDRGELDLLVNNASVLGPSPQPNLTSYPLDEFARVYDVNVVAPLALTQAMLRALRRARGVLLNVSSDAAVEPYEGWGGYGSAKAALDQFTAILGAEEPDIRVYALDPGDMRTDLHQQAFPDEDISDLPEPETVAPAVLRLIDERPASGRYRASELAAKAVA